MSTFRREQAPRESIFRGLGAKGMLCVLFGLLLLAAPLWPAADADVLAIAAAMRPVAWVALAVGVAFIALRLHQRARDTQRPTSAERKDPSPALARPSALAALRNAAGTSIVTPVFVDTIAVPEDPEPEPLQAGASTVGAADPLAGPREERWNANVLADIDAPRFENLCLAFYAQAGFSTSSRAHETDGGIDIWLQSRLMPAPRIVRCKHWCGDAVDLGSLRALLADMSTHGLHDATYVTSSRFDADAVEFAKANGIQIQDAQSLLKLVSQRSAEQQAVLLQAAYTAKPATGARSPA